MCGRILAALAFSFPLLGNAQWSWDGSSPWVPPSNVINSSTLNGLTMPMDAIVSEAPPQITLRLFVAGEYRIYRKHPDALEWGEPIATITTAAPLPTVWTDTDVEVGVPYEYGIGPVNRTTPATGGNVVAGIRVDRTQTRGRFAVVVAGDVVERLPFEYARYLADLEDDGWIVHEVVTSRAPDYTANGTGPLDADGVPTAPFPTEHIQIRNQLIALNNEYPGELKNVVLLGKVAVARSGITSWGPDGHGNRYAAGADAYYADMDGFWPDVGNNLNRYPLSNNVRADAVRDGFINVAGDNKFDINFIDDVAIATPGGNARLELGFGRVDLSLFVPGEMEALRTYFNKLHRYKRAHPDFRPGRRAIYRWQAWPTGPEVESVLFRSIPSVVGMENITLINPTTLNSLPSDPNGSGSFALDRDSEYSRIHGPYLFYFKGSGVPGLSTGGEAVFWTGLQSHWGHWFHIGGISSGTNAMQLRLAEENMTLSYTWSIWGNQFLYHRMGQGYDIGDMMIVSMSDRRIRGGRVIYDTNGEAPVAMNHMGCPSLRAFMFPGPGDLRLHPEGAAVRLNWTASEDPEVIGYHVDRRSLSGGSYTRLTGEPVTGTTFLDGAAGADAYRYIVRAVKLEQTGSGTWLNASLGASGSINLDGPPAPLAISSTELPGARWNESYSARLTTTGGFQGASWQLLAGALPPGLALDSTGRLHGTPTAAGDFSFTVQATDASGVQAVGEILLDVRSDQRQIFYPVAGQSMRNTGAVGSVSDASYFISGSTYFWSTFLRFDLSALNLHNGIRRATLRVTADERIPPAGFSLLAARLLQPAPAWEDSTLGAATAPADDTTLPPVMPRNFAFAQPFGNLEFDVTDMVRRGWLQDPASNIGFRLFTNTPSTFGNQIRIGTRHAGLGARPTLIVETSDAPRIDVQRPAVNPVSIPVESQLLLQTQVNALPHLQNQLGTTWRQVSGPGSVVFGNSSSASTTAVFPEPGDYEIRLTAHDGYLEGTATLVVQVLPPQVVPTFGPANGLIFRAALDESTGNTASVASSVGANRTGTLATIADTGGVPTWESNLGRVAGALRFSTSGQRVEIADDRPAEPLSGMQQLTLSAWINQPGAGGLARPIVTKRTSSSSGTIAYQMGISTASRLNAFIGNQSVTSGINLPANTWVHVAVVYNGTLPDSRVRLFVNGFPEATGTVNATSVPANAAPVRIGDYTATALTGSNAGFVGLLDEVRIYNRALSVGEIQRLAAAAPATVGPRIILGATSVEGGVGSPVSLAAQVEAEGTVDIQWSRPAGAGNAVFSAPFSSETSVTVSSEGPHVFRLTADDGIIATWADVTGMFVPTGSGEGLAGWRELHFGTSANEGNAADLANPAGDGLPNLLKYSLGLSPWTNYAGTPYFPSSTLQTVGGKKYLTLTFTRDTSVEDVSVLLEASGSLAPGSWSDIDPDDPNLQIAVLENTPSAGLKTVTVRDSVSIEDAPDGRRFLRLKAVSAE